MVSTISDWCTVDLAIAKVLAGVAGAAIDNSKLYRAAKATKKVTSRK